jgi:hypothetical protein
MRMLASTTRLVFALALLSGCSGTIGDGRSRYASDDDESASQRDGGGPAGRHGRLDAGSAQSPKRDGGLTENNDEFAEPPTEHSVTHACGDDIELPLAQGLRIRNVSLYQAVESPLFKDGAWVRTRAVPVVAGKQALVRVFVEPLFGYVRHPVRALLTMQRGAAATVLEDERTILASSKDDDLASTFLFNVPGELLSADTELSIALYERECEAKAGAAKDARIPAQGMAPLGAQGTGTLKVVVIPVSMSGRLPVTTAAELEKMRAYLLSYYPVAKVELSLRSRPLVWSSSLRGTDSRSWSNLLTQVGIERRNDAPPNDVYYFGLVQPADSFRTYCGSGCILGIAPQTTSVMPSMQVALGASFADAQSYETMVHELGHAHGRGHAPCAVGGIQGVDDRFPDRTGSTAGWGWDSRTNRLMAPTSKDVMGYCQPNWISSYTYVGLAERAVQISTRAFVVTTATSTRWHQLLLHADGTAQWGRDIETMEPAGERARATVRDAAGNLLAEIEIVRIPLADTDEAFVYLPDPAQGWSTITLFGRTLALETVAPAP